MNTGVKEYNDRLIFVYGVFLCMSFLSLFTFLFIPLPCSFFSYSFGFLYFLVSHEYWVLLFLLLIATSLIVGMLMLSRNIKNNIIHYFISILCVLDLITGNSILLTRPIKNTPEFISTTVLGFVCLGTVFALLVFIFYTIHKRKVLYNNAENTN